MCGFYSISNSFQYEWTPLQLSTRRNLTDMSLLLARAGGDLATPNPEGHSPLMSAVLHKNQDLCHGLLQLGADPNQSSDHHNMHVATYSPFLMACKKGYLAVVRTILSFQHTPSDWDCVQQAVVYVLSCFKNEPKSPRMLDLLLCHPGCNVNAAYTEIMSEETEIKINPIHLVVLLRAGLRLNNEELHIVFESIFFQANHPGNIWLLRIVPLYSPMYFLIEYVRYNIIQYVDSVQDAQYKRSIVQLFSRVCYNVPALFDITVSQVRNILYKNNCGRSVTYLLGQMEFLPSLIKKLLSLDPMFPHSYSDSTFTYNDNTEHETMDMDETEEDESNKDENPLHFTHTYPPSPFNVRLAKDWGVDIQECQMLRMAAESSFRRLMYGSTVPKFIADPHFPFTHMFANVTSICLNMPRQPKFGPINDMPRHLLSVDKYLHIQTDSAKAADPVKAITDIIVRFVHAITIEVRKRYNLDLLLIPCGSVHIGNKVNTFDELDFILKWNIECEEDRESRSGETFKFTHPAPHPKLRKKSLNEILIDVVKDIVIGVNGSLRKFHVEIEAVEPHEKSPGIYMLLIWTCHNNHAHRIAIDLTPSILLTELQLGDVWKRSHEIMTGGGSEYDRVLNELKQAPVSLVPMRGTIQSNPDGTVTTKWPLSLNICDWKIFKMLDGISPNIRVVYRLLKIIRDRICPREYKRAKIQILEHRRESLVPKSVPVPSGEQPRNILQGQTLDRKHITNINLKDSQIISSYILENILLSEVEKHSSSEEWDQENLVNRLIGCIRCIQDNDYKRLLSGKHVELLSNDSALSDINMQLSERITKDLSYVIKALSEEIPHGKLPSFAKKDVIVLNINGKANRQQYMKLYSEEKMHSASDVQAIIDDLGLSDLDSIYFIPLDGTGMNSMPWLVHVLHTYLNLILNS